MGRADPSSARRTSAACATDPRARPRDASKSNAQIPATCGVAIDVPLIRTYRGGTAHGSLASTAARALAMPVPYAQAAPGVTPPPIATTSGLRYRAPGTGPRELYAVTMACLSAAPTVNAPRASPGELIVRG